MKKLVLILVTAVLLFVAGSARAVPFWNIGDPGSTYQVWEFTDVTIANGGGWVATPEIDGNPYMGILVAEISVQAGDWDGDGFFGEGIGVRLEIPNRPEAQPYKEIWVEAGFTGELASLGVTTFNGGTVSDPTFEAPNIIGWQIWPNPYKEDIYFTIWPEQTGAQAYLDWVRVDTICIPEPATMCLLGLGGLILLRKRRTL